jgi:alpha-tubulin suppressor-like RCC1 family protein
MNARIGIAGASLLMFSVACGGSNLTPSLAVTPSMLAVTAGATLTSFTATLIGSSDTISWSLSPPGTGTLSTTTGGATNYTPPASVASATTATLTATAGSLLASATITINPGGTVPSPPTGVTAAPGNAQVTVSWSPESAVTSYNIYYSTSSGVTTTNGTKITGAASPYLQTGLTNGTTYYYVVTAMNANGESTTSPQVSAQPMAALPPAPTGVAATPGNAQVTISWSPVSGATTYNIYWSTTSGVGTAGTKISGATSPYLQTGLSNGTAYFYVVTALNSAGESAASVQASATPSSGVTAIAAGDLHTCAVVNGGVQCWGDNTNGDLGNNSTTQSNVPVTVFGLASGSGATAIAAGGYHSCAVVNGGVQCWGDNTNGDLGNNSTTESDVPLAVFGLASGSSATAIAAGEYYSCALVTGGILCWGANASGELGNNSTTQSNVPVTVSGLSGKGVTGIAAGSSHTCAPVAGGVECWGDNNLGDLGNNSTTSSSVPVTVSGLGGSVTAIAAGENGFHSCAIVSGGVQCWGDNNNGQLGNNSTTESNVPVTVSGLPSGSGATAIAAGENHTCAVVNGGVQCWGGNAYGQLGNNSTAESNMPVTVSGLPSGSGATAIAAGEVHTCAIVKGGVQCWGNNLGGQLGNNSTTLSTVPVTVFGLTP